MPLIEIQRVPGLPKDRAHVPVGTIFSEWLAEESLHAEVRINVNGRELQNDDELSFELKDDDRVIIFDQPKGGGLVGTLLNPLEHFNPIKFTQKVMNSLIKQPGIDTGQTKTSSNNSLKGQTNIARNGEARPDNFGQIRAYPDLIQESIFEYVNNNKLVTEWMNFGLGRYNVENVRYSESSIGALPEASYTVYNPGSNIAVINQGFQFDDVDGQDLPGPNQTEDNPAYSATANTVVSADLSGGQMAVKIVQQQSFDYFYDLPRPHGVTFVVNVSYGTPSGTVTTDVNITANLSDAQTSDDGSVTNPTHYYTFYFSNLSGEDAQGLPANTVINTTKFVLNDNEPLVQGPFFSPLEGEQLWLHFHAEQSGRVTASFSGSYWQVDEQNNAIAGTTTQFSGAISNATKGSDYRYLTLKLAPPYGKGRYAFQIYRTDNYEDYNVLKLDYAHIVTIRKNVTYPDDTIVRVTTKETENSSSVKERKYNALITRHVISYDPSAQKVDYTIRPSRKFSDVALFNWLVTGGQDESTIDIFGLYQIQSELDARDERLAYFDYTFDDEDVSLGQRIETICDAAGVSVYSDDGVLSFTLDSKRDKPVTVFNRSNTVETGYSLSYDMTLPGGYDGVEVQYRNPTTNKQAFIRYRIRNNQIELGQPTKAKKFEMMYIRDSFQADYRAQKECRRLLYSRMSMSLTALADGEWVNVGDMVQVPDTYDTNQQAGYIVSRNGNNFETSERINFSGSMFVVVTDALGNTTSRYAATQRADTDFGFIAAIPDIELNIYDGFDVQSPSRYVIATSEELDATQWLITEKKPPNAGGTTSLNLSEYSDLTYP
ncbi:host specificity factor TipJ family phage tail protein [Cedecea colo]|uniref:MoaD/ThiS family protein n=1 Tax=Cedecea colo TaxID=2552946 RepID=A0ABX0VK03_9ENTR|nr:host specificity factor TipJ family phage tail protein [Cedecea colo]NIY47258.1 MoaD/ThiS family protein [Cedecea colo]